MPFYIVKGDITEFHCDAIVNAANNSLLGGGGVDGAIHKAAGPELLSECKTLGGCPTGEARLTKGYDLPCKYVIHTVGPIWRGGSKGEEEKLYSCYIESLKLAKAQGCSSVAFPLISAGAYGYPKDKALAVATRAITCFLIDCEMDISLVLFDKKGITFKTAKYGGLESYIRDFSAQSTTAGGEMRAKLHSLAMGLSKLGEKKKPSDSALPKHPAPPYSAAHASYIADADECDEDDECDEPLFDAEPTQEFTPVISHELERAVKGLDESFSAALIRLIDERGMTDSECYKRANIDRKLFSKIRSNASYKPSKPTAVAFAVALNLNLDETNDLLRKAGYALSHSSVFDVVVEYFIKNEYYNIYDINEALFYYDQSLLGSIA